MCFEEVVKQDKWVQAMYEDIDSIKRNDTWDLVDFPKDKDCIGVKWIYKSLKPNLMKRANLKNTNQN
jgi:hypothetical protein